MGCASVWSLNLQKPPPTPPFGREAARAWMGWLVVLPDLQAQSRQEAVRMLPLAAAAGNWSDKGGGRGKSCLLCRSPLSSERILLSEALQSIHMDMLTQAFFFIPLLPIFNSSYPWEVSDCWNLRQPLKIA